MVKFSNPLEASNIGRKAWRFTPNDLPNNIPQIIDVVSGGIEVPDSSIINDFEFTPIEGIGDKDVIRSADEDTEGIVFLATNSEALTGTNSKKAITPVTLKHVLNSLGSASFSHHQTSPSANWSVNHLLNRIPNVDVYLETGEQVLADIIVTETTINVVFAQAQLGYIIAT